MSEQLEPAEFFSEAILSFPKLLVAAVNGPSVGVGVTILPQCDVAYAFGGDGGEGSEGAGGGRLPAATFWTPFLQLALVPEFCSSVTLPAILVSGEVVCVGVGGGHVAAERSFVCEPGGVTCRRGFGRGEGM